LRKPPAPLRASKEDVLTETRVRGYCTGTVRQEWRRLDADAYQRLEFETTLLFLEEHLPQKGLILDAGGGPGRYTIQLARRGYEVVLLDLTTACSPASRSDASGRTRAQPQRADRDLPVKGAQA
jgi:2-polyprenyl-3-methyl-5-hydroxy-6-metoxy-1,4-benzoquinol methylase